MSDPVIQKPLRLFIAISVPQRVKTALARRQAELRTCLNDASVSWTKEEQFHLTLRFLGDVEPGRLELLTNVLTELSFSFTPFQLKASKLGVFPHLRSPRVLWVGVEDLGQNLPEFAKALALATQEFTRERANESFSAHITLGRIKFMNRVQAGALGEQISKSTEQSFGEWQAGHVELMKSELSPAGARHELVASFKLGETDS